MQTLQEPVETIHVYVVRGEKKPHVLFPIFLSLLTLLILPVIGILNTSALPEIRQTIRVPALFLPLKTFRTEVTIIPTGSNTYPATTARGKLTIYNGSVLFQHLPEGMIFTGREGIEVVTDESVDVPAGNPPAFGIASVSAHSIISGTKGNISSLDVNNIYGTSLYVRNIHSFTGGKGSYRVTFITSQDRQQALLQARSTLNLKITGLLEGCKETATGSQTIHVTWICQFVTYQKPQGKVIHAEVHGKFVIVEVLVVVQPRILTK